MKHYKIISGLPDKVQTEIQGYLDRGWELHGQTYPTVHDGYHLVFQAITADIEEPKPAASDKGEQLSGFALMIKRVTGE